MSIDLGEIIDDLALRFILSCPEEDFKELDRLMFQFELAHWFYLDEYCEKFPDDLPTLSFANFCSEVFQRFPMLQTHAPRIKEHIASFNKYKNQVPVCGCLLLNKAFSKVIMVQAFGANSWNFPRGKINQGESHLECAIRETKEEIGYTASIESLDENKFIETTSGKKKIKLFIVENVDESTEFKTQTKNEIAKIRWQHIASMKPNQDKFRNIWPVIQKLKQWIRKMKKERKSSPNTREQSTSSVNSVYTTSSSDYNNTKRSKGKSQVQQNQQSISTLQNKKQRASHEKKNESLLSKQISQNNQNSQNSQSSHSSENIQEKSNSKRRGKGKRDGQTQSNSKKPNNNNNTNNQLSESSIPISSSFQNFSFDAKEMLKAIHG